MGSGRPCGYPLRQLLVIVVPEERRTCSVWRSEQTRSGNLATAEACFANAGDGVSHDLVQRERDRATGHP